MSTKRTSLFLILLLTLTVLACGVTQAAQPTATPIPPTPVPPTPTADPGIGIKTPIKVDDAELLIVLATNDKSLYDSGPFSVQTDPGQTVLHVEGRIVTGNVDFNALANAISLTDTNGKKYPLISNGTEKLFWEFMVPTSAQSFILHFPGGQTVDLTPVLKMTP